MARCTYTVPDKSASGDNLYGALICNQTYISYFWNAYGFQGNKDYWDDGFGWEDCCNTSKPLARAFNGCYLLTYSAQDYQNESWNSPILNWGRRYVRNNIDDLRSKCGDGSAIASTSGDTVEVYLGFFYTKDVPGRAETLMHESRHAGGKPHNATFPKGSVFGDGKGGADSNWGYEGAWMYGALYLWWFFAAGARTTSAMRARARQRGNLVIDNAFATHPGFSI
ncbi:MAG: hypothetical protein ABIT04_04705 [Novosphingobium sp.]